jgi:phage-related baseplate assembly protein
MATLSLKGIVQLVQDQAASMQAGAASILDFSTGSVLRAFVEANAMLGVWLQGLILAVLNITRLSTSFGSDVDSFVADFGLSRLAATASAGSVTFSRFTPTNAAVIPLGAQVQTADGTQTFQVVQDATNSAWSAGSTAYILAATVYSVTVPVQAITTGTTGNAGAGTVNALLTSISGVDTVTNALAFAGGSAGESDAAVKTRFVKFILGLGRGDHYGLASAIANTALIVQYTLTENYTYGGVYQPGFYYVVADDGTGAPSGAFLTSITNAVQSTRPLGMQAAVFAPAITTANVSMTITTATGYDHATVVGQVGVLIAANINALGLGVGLPFYDLTTWAMSVPGVSNVSGVLLNSLSGDAATIAANPKNTIKSGTVAIS